MMALVHHNGFRNKGNKRMEGNMRPEDLLLRCYANKHNDQWQAFCIDLSLAAQGDDFPEVKRKLESMIAEYVYDALAGEDRDYAEQLLNRTAPFKQVATYHYYTLMYQIGVFKDGIHRLFKSPLPLIPQVCAHE
jgi:hypothetical protein